MALRYSDRNPRRARPPKLPPSTFLLMFLQTTGNFFRSKAPTDAVPLPAEVITRWFDWSTFCCSMICPSSVPRAASMPHQFDRSAEDLGNAIHLEHVNVHVPDQRLATLFYVVGLGLTRDPYLMVSDTNMWINAGR